MYTPPMSHQPKTLERMRRLDKALSAMRENSPGMSAAAMYTAFEVGDGYAARDRLRAWLKKLVENDVLLFEFDPVTRLKHFNRGPAWDRYMRDMKKLRERFLELQRGVVRRSTVVEKEPDPLYEAWGMRFPAGWHDKPFRGARVYIDPLVRRNGQRKQSS